MQNLDKSTIYPSFVNTSYSPQLDTSTLNISSNVNSMQDISVALDNMPQAPTMTSIITPLVMPTNMNEIQPLYPNLDIQANHTLQDYPQESKYSFFYAPYNDFQIYHIICEEMPLSFEFVSQLISNTENNSNDYMIFYHEQPETKKIYQITCEMVSHKYLNKIIYGIQFTRIEHQQHQQQEFSKRHQGNLKFHLKKDLIHYLAPKQTYDQNYLKGFIQDCYTYKNMINSNTDTLNHFQQYDANALPSDQFFTSQQDNSYGEDNHNQGYYNNNYLK